MSKEELLKNLNKLGFGLMEPDVDFDVNKTLAATINSQNTRYWEGFPVLLINAFKHGDFDYVKVDRDVDKDKKDSLKKLTLLSLAFYKSENLDFFWMGGLIKTFSKKDQKDLNIFRLAFEKSNESILLTGKIYPSKG